MENLNYYGPKYGPFTKASAKYLYAFYSAEAVVGTIDWPTAKKFMDFYKTYLWKKQLRLPEKSFTQL